MVLPGPPIPPPFGPPYEGTLPAYCRASGVIMSGTAETETLWIDI